MPLIVCRMALAMIQRNIRKWLTLRHWHWWKLYTRVKPLLSIARQEDEMRKCAEELEKAKEELARLNKLQKELEEQNTTLLQAKNDMYLQLQAEQENMGDAEERIAKLITQKGDYEQQLKELEERLADEENCNEELTNIKQKLESDVEELKKDVEDLELNLQKAEQDKQAKENQIRALQVCGMFFLSNYC